MSDAVALLPTEEPHRLEATRRRLTPRQAEAVMALVRATEAEIEEVGYSGLTVRSVARRAGVAPATAYNYFSSKDHLLAEVLWRRMQSLAPVDPGDRRPTDERLRDAVQAMVFTTESAALLGRAAGGGHGSHGLGRRPRFRGRGGGTHGQAGGTRGRAMTTTHPPLTYSPYAYEIHEDPYPVYARLRAEAPVYRNDELDFFALSRHADVLAAFRNVDAFSNSYGVSLDPSAFGPDAHKFMSFLALDPPRHTRMRSLVGKGFTPSKVAQMEDEVRAIAVEHLDAALERGTFDFIADFAGKLPMDVISELVGVPGADRSEIRRLADLVVHREDGVLDVPQAGLDAALSLVGYYQGMVDERRRAPKDDLTSALAVAELDGERLTDEEIVGFLFLMVVAGNETTTKLLGNAWYWAWHHPDQRSKPFADPDRVADWVEETLRFDTSSQMLLRMARTDLELHGVRIGKGDRVLLLVGSANRDETVFPDPDRYDLDRDTSKLVSFGSGRHFCMGAPLARLEARVALGELVTRVSDYDIDLAGVERVHSVNVRGLAALPTTVALR
jgi:cytochrome P450